jgi:hypothetical protein
MHALRSHCPSTNRCPCPPLPRRTHTCKILRAPARSAAARRRAPPPPAAPRPPARVRRAAGSGRARMDARGGQAGGWPRSEWPRRWVRRARGWAAEQRDSCGATRSERMRKNVSAAADLISRRGCGRRKLVGKGQDAARTRAAKGRDHAAIHRRRVHKGTPSASAGHGASASAAPDTETDERLSAA